MENNQIEIKISREILMEITSIESEKEAFNWLNEFYGINPNRIHSIMTISEIGIQPLLIVNIKPIEIDGEAINTLSLADDLENAGISSEWIKKNIIK
jgi:hypothetical protein